VCITEENLVIATGPVLPSAESMTHGVVYNQNSAIKWVIHTHSPDIWHKRVALKLPSTAPDVPYGSVEMTREVARLFRDTDVAQHGIFAMDGHEDGIVSFAGNAETAAAIMINTLAYALELN
jgi:L-ribulose-5-phosphate 4-epimerase